MKKASPAARLAPATYVAMGHLKRALLASKSIALSPGPSGVYLSSLFAKWGIADELKPKIKLAIGVDRRRGGAR